MRHPLLTAILSLALVACERAQVDTGSSGRAGTAVKQIHTAAAAAADLSDPESFADARRGFIAAPDGKVIRDFDDFDFVAGDAPAAVRWLARETGGLPQSMIAETFANIPAMARIFGGTVIGADVGSGVVPVAREPDAVERLSAGPGPHFPAGFPQPGGDCRPAVPQTGGRSWPGAWGRREQLAPAAMSKSRGGGSRKGGRLSGR